MATQVAFELTANGSQAEGSVKSLKSQLKEAQQDVQVLSDKFGATSQAAIDAARKAAKLKDAIGDAKALTDAYNPDAKFKAFGAALQGVAGGFAAVQGAQALLGSESEDLQKTLAKVQGAMALSQGLNSLGEAGDAFKNLGTQAVAAFNKIKVAIGSTGIGLLVIALGVIVAYWDDIKGAVIGVSSEQKKLLDTQNKSAAAAQKSLDSISKSENILKLNGKSEKDILNLKIAATKQTITQLEAQLTTQKTMRQSQIDAAKRNKNILEGILKFLTAPITVLLKAVDALGKVAGEDFGLEDKFFGGIAKMVFNPEEVATEGDKAIAETETKLNELKNSQAGFQLQIQQIDKDAANKSIENKKKKDSDAEALKKKQEADEKTRLDNQIAQNNHTDELIQQNRLSAIKDAFTKRQMELATQEQKEIDDELLRLNNKQITQEQYEINKLNITQKYANLQTELIATEEQKRKDKADADNKKKLEDEKAAADEIIKIAQAEADQKKAIQDAQFGALDAGIGFLKEISGKSKALQKTAIIAENAIGIAKMVIANNTANIAALATPQAIATGGVAAAPVILFNNIKTALGVATTIAATAKALAAVGGGSAGTPPSQNGAGPNAPLRPQVQTTNLNQGQINQLASATSRAFVLESDVSGSQERIQRLNRAARIN